MLHPSRLPHPFSKPAVSATNYQCRHYYNLKGTSFRIQGECVSKYTALEDYLEENRIRFLFKRKQDQISRSPPLHKTITKSWLSAATMLLAWTCTHTHTHLITTALGWVSIRFSLKSLMVFCTGINSVDRRFRNRGWLILSKFKV